MKEPINLEFAVAPQRSTLAYSERAPRPEPRASLATPSLRDTLHIRMPARILCASAELAVEALRAAELIGWKVETEIASDPIHAALSVDSSADGSRTLGIALIAAPTLEQLVELGHRRLPRLALATLERTHPAARLRDVALDLGITTVTDIGPLLAALRLLDAGAEHPWAASLRTLGEPDRARLRSAQTQGSRSGASFVTAGAEHYGVAYAASASAAPLALGSASDTAAAVAALRDTDRTALRIEASVDGVDSQAVLDVLFGPRRALSDPASKSALMPYGIPLPTEELCGSASRAAVEAGRIGFPVRISLASPDLRVWDHADLSVDMVDNAARVRDTFRQLMGLAKARLVTTTRMPEPAATRAIAADDVIDRVLGVMVTATAESRAMLGARAWPLPEGRVAMEVAFADAHGAAADDRTLLVMPATTEQIERALERLAGHTLILGSARSERRAHLEAIADVLHRLCAFVHDQRREVTSVELRPLALLLDGTIEAREACVTVSDAFERMLQTLPSARPA